MPNDYALARAKRKPKITMGPKHGPIERVEPEPVGDDQPPKEAVQGGKGILPNPMLQKNSPHDKTIWNPAIGGYPGYDKQGLPKEEETKI